MAMGEIANSKATRYNFGLVTENVGCGLTCIFVLAGRVTITFITVTIVAIDIAYDAFAKTTTTIAAVDTISLLLLLLFLLLLLAASSNLETTSKADTEEEVQVVQMAARSIGRQGRTTPTTKATAGIYCPVVVDLI